RTNSLLVMDPQGMPIDLPGEHTKEPAFGLPATWVDEGLREEANFRGYTVVDPATVLTTHLTEIIKNNMSELLSYAETKKLIDDLPDKHKGLVEDLIPSVMSVSGVQRVLQTLLGERISIRDLPAILEAIAEAAAHTQNTVQIAEHVRTRLSRQICAGLAGADGAVPIISLSPHWEQAFAEALIGQGEERQLAMAPSQLQDFIHSAASVMERAASEGETPALVASAGVRPFVRSVVERFRPQTAVLSHNEIHAQAKLRTVGQL
ncbi:MAG: FHIPEP family type III secretion protein, partial [Pseudomonadota bacterium]